MREAFEQSRLVLWTPAQLDGPFRREASLVLFASPKVYKRTNFSLHKLCNMMKVTMCVLRRFSDVSCPAHDPPFFMF